MHRRALLLSGPAALLIATGVDALAVYVAEDGQVLGPFDEAGLKARLESQTKAAVTLVWMQGMADWTAASQVPELAVLVGRLPLNAPFDAAKYLIGAWMSDDHAMGIGKDAFVGKRSIVFAADGTFTMLSTGSRNTVTVKPGSKPREPIVDSEFLFWNSSVEGTYSVQQGADGFFEVKMKGTMTDNSSGKNGERSEGRETDEFRQLGPDHMQTRYGVDYYRTAN
jgi:hypothetical protein